MAREGLFTPQWGNCERNLGGAPPDFLNTPGRVAKGTHAWRMKRARKSQGKGGGGKGKGGGRGGGGRGRKLVGKRRGPESGRDTPTPPTDVG